MDNKAIFVSFKEDTLECEMTAAKNGCVFVLKFKRGEQPKRLQEAKKISDDFGEIIIQCCIDRANGIFE